MTTPMTTLWWVRNDLRLDDNPALAWAAARGPVVPVVVATLFTPPSAMTTWAISTPSFSVEALAR